MSFDPDAPAAEGALFGLPFTADEARVVVLPVPWEATTSYRRGTRNGPAAVLAASAQVDLTDLQFGDAWRAGIAMLEPDPQIHAWDREAEPDALAVIESGGGEPECAARVNALGARLNDLVHAATRAILDGGAIPALLGGDHSTPFGAIRAVAERHPGLGILHIDAHADLRDAYEGFTWSHASIFHNVLERIPQVGKLVQVGIRDFGEAELARITTDPRVRTFFDVDLARELAEGTPWIGLCRRIVGALPDPVYLSFDIDGLDPALCPNTGTPVPGGLSFRDFAILLEVLAQNRRIVGFDLNEVGSEEWDGNVGARCLYKLCLAAIRSTE